MYLLAGNMTSSYHTWITQLIWTMDDTSPYLKGINRAVPQDSCLGPLSFLVCIDDLPFLPQTSHASTGTPGSCITPPAPPPPNDKEAFLCSLLWGCEAMTCASLSITLLKHYVIASQSQRRLQRKASLSLGVGGGGWGYTTSLGLCDASRHADDATISFKAT